MPSPNGMPQRQIDAIFQEFDAVLLSLDLNFTTRHPQPSSFFVVHRSTPDGLKAAVLAGPDALAIDRLGMM
jgi:hypothetical protein